MTHVQPRGQTGSAVVPPAPRLARPWKPITSQFYASFTTYRPGEVGLDLCRLPATGTGPVNGLNHKTSLASVERYANIFQIWHGPRIRAKFHPDPVYCVALERQKPQISQHFKL